MPDTDPGPDGPDRPDGPNNLVFFLTGRGLSSIAAQIQSVAIGWQIYAIAHSPAALGWVGLALFTPIFLLTLPAGNAADRLSRRNLLTFAMLLQALASFSLAGLAIGGVRHLAPYYAILLIVGAGRAISAPASQSFLPQLVSMARLPRAIAWASSIFQTAIIAGPALGGALYILGPAVTYAVCGAFFLVSAITTVLIRPRPVTAATAPPPFSLAGEIARLRAGIEYVRSNPILLGATTLDLFAVLLGGATALLPIYARDILHVGPGGLGLLRSAPAAGAFLTGLALAAMPLRRHAGPAMFICVAIFGVATIIFGISHNYSLSLAALLVLGASDMVSVFIRSFLVQSTTPDAMRGRVSAVNMLFIGASNELGEFESGFTAALFGTVPAVVLGGTGTLIVAGLWAYLFPALRDCDRLTKETPEEGTQTLPEAEAAT